jgi:hypothetical protein
LLRITWTGLGLVALPVFLFFLCGGAFVGRDVDAGHLGIAFAFAVLGMLVGAAANYAIGRAMNRRTTPDGRVVWTDRHQFEGMPVEDFSMIYLVFAALMIPCITTQFIPAPATLVIWLAFVVVGLVLFNRRQVRGPKQLARSRKWTYREQAGNVWSAWPTLLGADTPFTTPATNLVEGADGDLAVGLFTAGAGGKEYIIFVVHLPVALPTTHQRHALADGTQSEDPAFARAVVRSRDMYAATKAEYHAHNADGWRLVDRDLILARVSNRGFRREVEPVLDQLVKLAHAIPPEILAQYGRPPRLPASLLARATPPASSPTPA